MKARLLLEFLVSSLAIEAKVAHEFVPSFAAQHLPREIWRQKVFCVLSSQYSAYKSASIASLILDSIPFFEGHPTTRQVEQACVLILTSPTTRYRFPNVRAKQISQCWFSFSQIADEYYDFI